MKTETTLEEMHNFLKQTAIDRRGVEYPVDSDWKSVWYYADAFNIEDVSELIASVNGANDYANWVALFKLKNGKFGYLTAGCDYTGWGCQEGGHSEVVDTWEELVNGVCTEDDRSRLELK